MKKERFSIVDLLEELRLKEIFNISDVEFAILETSGKLSVELKSQKQPLTPSDLNLSTKYSGLSANLIIDGEIMHEHLKHVNSDEKWLKNELKIRNITSEKEVVLAVLDSEGNLCVHLKSHIPNDARILE